MIRCVPFLLCLVGLGCAPDKPGAGPAANAPPVPAPAPAPAPVAGEAAVTPLPASELLTYWLKYECPETHKSRRFSITASKMTYGKLAQSGHEIDCPLCMKKHAMNELAIEVVGELTNSQMQQLTARRVGILCPVTGKPVPTGMTVGSEAELRGIGDNTVVCPHCGQPHKFSGPDTFLEGEALPNQDKPDDGEIKT